MRWALEGSAHLFCIPVTNQQTTSLSMQQRYSTPLCVVQLEKVSRNKIYVVGCNSF
jgi:hypothetical protein